MIRRIDEDKRRFCRSLVGCGLGRILTWPCAPRAVLALAGSACVAGCADETLHADVVVVGAVRASRLRCPRPNENSA